jgi:predicted HAD superfamily Cof-like phosphohydrolase
MKKFVESIQAFNAMYGLMSPSRPTTEHLPVEARMGDFKRIISAEVSEVDDLLANVKAGQSELDTLTELADWLGDIVVYCASEMVRYGIPIEATLAIIMASNMSKLGEDGKPIITAGKVGKGPNYWKPEPQIKGMLMALREEVQDA